MRDSASCQSVIIRNTARHYQLLMLKVCYKTQPWLSPLASRTTVIVVCRNAVCQQL